MLFGNNQKSRKIVENKNAVQFGPKLNVFFCLFFEGWGGGNWMNEN